MVKSGIKNGKHFTMYSRACASASFSGRLTALGRGTETEGAEEVRDSYGEFLKGIAGLLWRRRLRISRKIIGKDISL